MTLPIPILDVVLENMEAFLDNYKLQDEWEFSVPIDYENLILILYTRTAIIYLIEFRRS